MKPVIQFENVYKQYYLGSKRSHLRYLLPDRIQERWSLHKRATPEGSLSSKEFWALKGVSFQVNEGEMLGMIGPNGAGKTTALSLIAGITIPTSGFISVKGKIGALIKLGAGFHPDLTGHENIYLNGSILGLRKHEIDQIYDEIVQFSGLEEFINTPVKRYSSGMFVRLGFSVAVHINPEILLVDEVLSVGDMSFQTRCFNRIGELKDAGTTIIFVSHNMHHIAGFCDKVIYLNHGEAKYFGDPSDTIDVYTRDVMNEQSHDLSITENNVDRVNGTGRIVIRDVIFLDKDGCETKQIHCGEAVTVRIHYQATEKVENSLLDVVIRDSASGNLFQATNRDLGVEFHNLDKDGYIEIQFNSINANNQVLNFFFTWWNSRHTEQFDWKRYVKLNVIGSPNSSGRLMLDSEWRVVSG